MAPVPIVLCGREKPRIEYMISNLMPQYEITHVCTSTESATSEIPALLRGEQLEPSSGFGTSTSKGSSPSRTPQAILIGGGFSTADYDAIRNACDAVKPMPYFRVDVKKNMLPGGGAQFPPPDRLMARVLESMEIASQGKGPGEWEAGLYFF